MKKLCVFLSLFLILFTMNAESLISFDNIPLGCGKNFVIHKMSDIGFHALLVDDGSITFGSKDDPLRNIYTIKPYLVNCYFEGDSLYEIHVLGYSDLYCLKKEFKEKYPDLYVDEDREYDINERELVLVDAYSGYQISIVYQTHWDEHEIRNVNVKFSKKY